MGKYTKLFISLFLDGIGMLSYLIPILGELTDTVWAPLAGYIMTRLYKGEKGKVAGIIAFLEEAIPGMDIIPTFTIMWIYTYVFLKEEPQEKANKIIS